MGIAACPLVRDLRMVERDMLDQKKYRELVLS